MSECEPLDLAGDRLRLLRRLRPVALVLHRQVPDPVAVRNRPLQRHRSRLEPTLVERRRDELVHLRPHPVRLAEEQPHPLRHGLVPAEKVLQNRRIRALRMRSLRDLRELVRVAEQHDVPRRRPHSQHVRQRHLTRLVDEERVHRLVLAREQE